MRDSHLLPPRADFPRIICRDAPGQVYLRPKPPFAIARTPRPNQLYVVVSLALVLFLLGLVGGWTLQARQLGRQLQEELDVLVELEAGYPAGRLDSIRSHLRASPYLKSAATIEFVAKEEALAELGEELSGDLVDVGMANPLRDVLTFNVHLEYLQPGRLDSIAADVQALPGVAGVYYQENFVERVAHNARRLGYLLLGLAALFTGVAALLIHNTVRLSLYANRFLIKTQELVGASWGFIRRPATGRADWQGLISGLLALGALVALHYWLRSALPEVDLRYAPRELALLAGGLVGLGVGINLLSHYVVVRRYLRLRVDDLY